MMRMTMMTAALALLAATVGCQTMRTAASASDVETGVAEAHAAFYAALNTMFTGDAEAMLAVWSREDDAMYLPPTGQRLVGWDAISTSWRKQAALRLGGEVKPTDVHIRSLAGGIAMTVTTEVGVNPGTAGGAMKVNIRSTKLWRMEDGRWKVFYDHVDPLPKLGEAVQ